MQPIQRLAAPPSLCFRVFLGYILAFANSSQSRGTGCLIAMLMECLGRFGFGRKGVRKELGRAGILLLVSQAQVGQAQPFRCVLELGFTSLDGRESLIQGKQLSALLDPLGRRIVPSGLLRAQLVSAL